MEFEINTDDLDLVNGNYKNTLGRALDAHFAICVYQYYLVCEDPFNSRTALIWRTLIDYMTQVRKEPKKYRSSTKFLFREFDRFFIEGFFTADNVVQPIAILDSIVDVLHGCFDEAGENDGRSNYSKWQ